jgi:hypothetical protein
MSCDSQSRSETHLPHDRGKPEAAHTSSESTGSCSEGGTFSGDGGMNNSSKRAWRLALLGVVLFFLLMVRRLISLDCLFLEDAWDQFWPWFSYLADSLADGRFPLWEPHSSCGFPFHANAQAGVFYPIYGIAALTVGGGYAAFQFLWLLHWLSAILGFFFLLKQMDFSPPAAFAGSLTFGFSGFFIGNAEHTVFINVVSYVPWTLLSLNLACEKRVLYAAAAGVLLGLGGLSGYPGVFWYSAVMVILWCFLRYGVSRRTAVVVCLLATVACIVVSPAYVAFLVEGSGYTDRAGPLDVETACHSQRFPLSAMISLIVPRFTVDFRELIDCDVSMSNGYFGVLGLVSVLLAVLYEPIRRQWKWLLIWILVAWLFSLGTEGGIRVIAYYALPVLRYMRHSALFRVFWLMGGAILTAVVIDRLLSDVEEDRGRIGSLILGIIGAVLFACVCVYVWTVLVAQEDARPEELLAAGVQAGIATSFLAAFFLYARMRVARSLIVGLVLLILLFDLAAHFVENRVTVCADGDGRARAAQLQAAAAARAKETFTGTEKRIDAPMHHPNQGLFDRAFYVRSYNPASSPDYDFLVGGAVAGSASDPVRTPFLSVLENAPRFWLTPEVTYAEVRSRRALATLRGTGFPAPVPVFVHSRVSGATDRPLTPVVPGTYGLVQVMQYSPEQIVLRVETPGEAWLFCTERYAPGWTAFVDGTGTKVHKADFCFRVIPIPKGAHEVRLQYAPWLHKPFWLLSWATIVIIPAALALACLRETRQTRRSRS